MRRGLIKNISSSLINEKLTMLRSKFNETLFTDDKYKERNGVIDEIQQLKLDYDQVKELTIENILFYLNYNKRFGLSKFAACEYSERLKMLNRFLTLNMKDRANKVHFADFLVWSVGYFYRDKDMVKLVKFFCDNTTYKDSKIVYEVYALYSRIFDESLCKDAIIEKYNQMQKEQENKFKSRNLFKNC